MTASHQRLVLVGYMYSHWVIRPLGPGHISDELAGMCQVRMIDIQ
jgi:hypothetical protein